MKITTGEILFWLFIAGIVIQYIAVFFTLMTDDGKSAFNKEFKSRKEFYTALIPFPFLFFYMIFKGIKRFIKAASELE